MSEFESLIEASKRGDVDEVKTVIARRPDFINQRDQRGATALHYAAFGGHRAVVEELTRHGAEINATDSQHGAAPTGWAIEYLREMGGFLAIELDDLAYAIRRGDAEWVTRFLKRFPALIRATDVRGVPFEQLACESGKAEIVDLFKPNIPSV